MIYLKTFKLSNCKKQNSNIYPYNIFISKEPDVFVFNNITVLYGNNGSGKSTILNLMAHRLNLKGKEIDCPRIEGIRPYFDEYALLCEYDLGEDEFGKKIKKIPENSKYIKSEEILYEIRKIQQESVLRECFRSNCVRNIY